MAVIKTDAERTISETVAEIRSEAWHDIKQA